VEPENEYGEEFGEDRLLTLFVENSRKPLEEIAAKVTRSVLDWSSAAEQPDDMTLIIVRRL
jgi:serine phosphatase RsbU (regulator of sigma subunit)